MTNQKPNQLRVLVGGKPVGALARSETHVAGAVFGYDRETVSNDCVSLSMPMRLASYEWATGIHPIFEMHLPEGELRAELLRRFSKTVKGFDDFALLEVIGPHQLGRVTVSPQSDADELPSTDLGELLSHRGTEDLFISLVRKYAHYSGVSGVQPKVLVRASDPAANLRITHRGATHIVKAWRPDDYPELAANEFFCMRAAMHAGLAVPEVQLSEDGKLLTVQRFDMTDSGYLGFEDLCALNGWSSDAKYDGSYEGAAKQIKAYVSPENLAPALESFFMMLALSATVRNGDAHLKNFGVLYDHAGDDGAVWLSPAYDIVSTTPYIKNDSMALTLCGSKAWPKRAMLERFGRSACGLTEGRCSELLGLVQSGVLVARAELETYMESHSRFSEVGQRMLDAWDSGVERSLLVVSRGPSPI